MSRIVTQALAYAADLIAAALGVAVQNEPLGPAEEEVDDLSLVGAVVSLSEGVANPGEVLLSSATPYEFAHDAPLQLLYTGGDEAARKARRDADLVAAAAAIAADPTLGGLVDWAEITQPDPSFAARYHACEAQLSLLYSAPTALG